MSEEEKEAIEDLKLQIEQDKEELPYSEECLKYKEAILNLIEKQQKEIEKLNIDIEARKEEKQLLIEDMNNYYDLYIQQQKEIKKEHQNWKELLHEYGLKCEELKNSISKDKIKEKIKEKENKINDLYFESDAVLIDDLETEIKVLKELLDE